MHYYSFNIEHYTSHTARLSILEDIAYRRLLDSYYLNERPLNGCTADVAREIGMQDYSKEVEYVLSKFFTKVDDEWVNKRADIEIQFYQKQKKTASKAGKASAKARRIKASEQAFNDRSTTVQPISNHESVISNHESVNTKYELVDSNKEITSKDKTLVEQKPDDGVEIFKYWQAIMNHPRSAYTVQRKKLVNGWLKYYSQEDCRKAILGCSITPHNMGDNKEGRVYDSFELIFRDAKHIDDYMRNCDKPPAGNIKTIEQTNMQAQSQADRIKKHLGFDNE